MELLIVSDAHGDTRALLRAAALHPQAEALIFLGDGVRDVPALAEANPRLRIYAVRGNCDYGSLEPEDGLAAFGGVLFYYTHGHRYEVKSGLDALARAAAARGADVALFGHTHIPVCEQRAGVTLFNPGALSSVYGRGTYGVVSVQDGRAEFRREQL